MKLAAPFMQLPLLFNASLVTEELKNISEQEWMPHPQGFPGNSMLPLVAVNGDPTNEGFAGEMSPTPYLKRCPYLFQILATLRVPLGRTRLMRLSGNAEVTRHADQGYYWADRVRIHVPILTQPSVRFECGDAVVNMAAGECWIFDTWRQHRVLNDSAEQRIHLVVDTVGSEPFWMMVGAGRDHNKKNFANVWSPKHIEYDRDAEVNPRFERANVPTVMTPWELKARLGFILSEAPPSANTPMLRQNIAQFCRHWQALWAAFGEHKEGWADYQGAMNQFMQQIDQLCANVVLNNELNMASVVHTLVAKVAISGAQAWLGDGEIRGAAASGSSIKHHQVAPVDPMFDRPVFIVSSPRSGSTLLFETLLRSPSLLTIGGESHTLMETMSELSPATNGKGSNRLTSSDATPEVVAELRRRFYEALKSRDGSAEKSGRVRMLEKTPKNALRIPFLKTCFPEAVFLYLYRDPRETMGSMIDAWQSGRFNTYPNLPGWTGLPWSLLLTPGWEVLNGKSIAEIVAAQWESTTKIMIDDLASLPKKDVVVTTYHEFLRSPAKVIEQLCSTLNIRWDETIPEVLPLSKYTLSTPNSEKWRRHEEDIQRQLPRIEAAMSLAERFLNERNLALI
ncbi:sulfotransferase [Permianibacter aggregans]|uniref:Aspartyl/asparaginyl beta-hydroxylase n=1 Tax=Permianibacter aggregans TaxID=1510150 RepID=A0A4R6UW38_9GAMM|nr:sulfotransferase [Permianibacter aggregans]QGX39557.1 hypothetical protein E2H98_07785 [Permianibacter aggregans]TDQ49695.1 aspartyl/asparaginyl beta-hydroxylase [Permianibacter aggregans]